jgi:hypothetical protein
MGRDAKGMKYLWGKMIGVRKKSSTFVDSVFEMFFD